MLGIIIIFRSGLALGDEKSGAPLNVILIYSGNIFNPGGVIESQALRDTVTSGTSRPVNFCVETLYAYNLSAVDFDIEFVNFMHHKYERQKIDLIITGGSVAMNFMVRNHPQLWPEVPVLFCSVDEVGNQNRKFPPGITGLTLKFDPEATMDFALRLQPKAQHMVVVAGTAESDRVWLPEIQRHLQNRYPNLSVTYLTNQTMAELTGSVSKLPAETVVLYTTLVRDAAGQRFTPIESASELADASGAPIYGVYETQLGHGIVGGMMPSFEADGCRAGELALRLIAGAKPEAIPVQSALPAVPKVDWRQLKRWHLSENLLPPGCEVRFRPPTLWEQHKDYVIGGLCIIFGQAGTIVILLWQRARRRRCRNIGAGERDAHGSCSQRGRAQLLGMEPGQ